ncbi:AI-2E family transporter [Thalassobaculum sp.]|uniref:AI-2E family transporter n=1 Tax=Thalassobaculum sp. TaxID=2022740 RepID=UPI0032EBA326
MLTLEERLPSLSFAVWGAAICIFVAALHVAQDVVIPIVGAMVLAIVLTPVSRYLMRRFMFPNSVAAFAAFVLAFVVILSLLFVAVPTVQRLSEDFPTLAYRVEYKLRSIALSMEAVKRWSKTVEELLSLGGRQPDGGHVVVREGGGAVGQLISSTPKVIAQIVFMLVLVFFFVRDRRGMQRIIIRWAPSQRARFRAARVCRLVQNNAASYLLSVSMINLTLGAATAIAFYIAGMPEPLAWGAAMAVLNFVPYIGPLILQVVSFLAGLVIYPSFEAALIPPAVLIGLNVIEANFGMPLVMERRFLMSPLATLVAIAFGAWLWGTPGAILAVPLVVMATTGASAWRLER